MDELRENPDYIIVFVNALRENPNIVSVWELSEIPSIKSLQLTVSQAYMYFMKAKLIIENGGKNEK